MLMVAVLGELTESHHVRLFCVVVMEVQQMIQVLFLTSMIKDRVQFIGFHQSGGFARSRCRQIRASSSILSRWTFVIVKVVVVAVLIGLFGDVIIL